VSVTYASRYFRRAPSAGPFRPRNLTARIATIARTVREVYTHPRAIHVAKRTNIFDGPLEARSVFLFHRSQTPTARARDENIRAIRNRTNTDSPNTILSGVMNSNLAGTPKTARVHIPYGVTRQRSGMGASTGATFLQRTHWKGRARGTILSTMLLSERFYDFGRRTTRITSPVVPPGTSERNA